MGRASIVVALLALTACGGKTEGAGKTADASAPTDADGESLADAFDSGPSDDGGSECTAAGGSCLYYEYACPNGASTLSCGNGYQSCCLPLDAGAADASDAGASDDDASSPCVAAGGDCLAFSCGQGGASTLSCGQSGLFCCVYTAADCEDAGGTCVVGLHDPACVMPGPQTCPHLYNLGLCCLGFAILDAGPCSNAPGAACIGDDLDCPHPSAQLQWYTCAAGAHCCLLN
jgi:hypothetical protein